MSQNQIVNHLRAIESQPRRLAGTRASSDCLFADLRFEANGELTADRCATATNKPRRHHLGDHERV